MTAAGAGVDSRATVQRRLLRTDLCWGIRQECSQGTTGQEAPRAEHTRNGATPTTPLGTAIHPKYPSFRTNFGLLCRICAAKLR